MSSPVTARLFSGLVGSRFWPVLIFAVGLVVAFLFWRRRIRFALRFAVFSSGFAGACASILILLLFQVSSGTLHLHLALLTTAFMAGTALGGAWATHRVRGPRSVTNVVYWLEVGVAVIGLLVLLASHTLAWSGPVGALVGYGLLALAAGFLLGAEFPVISRAYLDAEPNCGLARAAGNLYSADLFGGVLSSLIVPAMLIPLLGMVPTALLVVLTKAVSITMLRLSRN
jgi:predicted membrane-bound spermidine synthase